MLLNVDRRRIYIFSGVGVFLILMLGLYHAPAYVPAEVSRIKTSVSTWLKGTEPSLNDELYKDSPHFSSSTKQHQQATNEQPPSAFEPLEVEEEEDPYEIKDPSGEEAFHILPIDTDTNETPDLLPPDESASNERPSHSSDNSGQLPKPNDFIGVLPPVDALSAVPVVSHSTQTAAQAHATSDHPHMEEVTSPSPESTTLATRVSTSSVWHPHETLPANAKDVFEFDKWYSGEDDAQWRS